MTADSKSATMSHSAPVGSCGSSAEVTVADVCAAINDSFPEEWAEQWDRVGLLSGDPASRVTSVFVSLDVTRSTVDRALGAGANVLVTHHPAYLVPPSRLTPSEAGPVFGAVSSGLALIAAHTNLDRSPAAALALTEHLGLPPGSPLEDSLLPLARISVYAPPDSIGLIERALRETGVGRIGEYDACSFSVEGTGSFSARQHSSPVVGAPGESTHAFEIKLETVCPRAMSDRVVHALRAAHPYEEPLITVDEIKIARSAARLGRLVDLAEPQVLSEFAYEIGVRTQCSPRVRGKPDRTVKRVAVVGGSAGSSICTVLNAGADVLVAGEVRYHDAVMASEHGLSLVEIGHDVSEWPLVPVIARAVSHTSGLDRQRVVVDRAWHGQWSPRQGRRS